MNERATGWPSDGSVRLLISVRNADEADGAIEGGADVIDIKEPARGVLGMAEPATIANIVERVAGRKPLSAALGELADLPVAVQLPTGLDYVKIGLAHACGDWRAHLRRQFESVQPAGAVAVAYADGELVDAPCVADIVNWACQLPAAGLLIDTAVKDGRDLFDWLNLPMLERLLGQAHDAGLFVALAGSLGWGESGSIERAIRLGPDIIAVRGAACAQGDRNQQIDAAHVRQLTRLIVAARS